MWPADHDGGDADFTIDEPAVEMPSMITTTSTTTTHAPSTIASSSNVSPATPGSPMTPPIPAHSPTLNSTSASSVQWTPHYAEGTSPARSVEFATPPRSDHSEQLDYDHDDDAPLRFCHIDDVLGPRLGDTAWFRRTEFGGAPHADK
ncbi:hypothetical protein GUJ93_ZPchr0008g12982 [Zizania palustris]|uniref:Uncharacterized protein n=1 Tax=Zizania palustris TaxID=103762 RepID=A0A8J5RI79_ZIZPA|nr:hypothetical protein GUJ93_ZPchr0008g12982 [Zizania palustris]